MGFSTLLVNPDYGARLCIEDSNTKGIQAHKDSASITGKDYRGYCFESWRIETCAPEVLAAPADISDEGSLACLIHDCGVVWMPSDNEVRWRADGIKRHCRQISCPSRSAQEEGELCREADSWLTLLIIIPAWPVVLVVAGAEERKGENQER